MNEEKIITEVTKPAFKVTNKEAVSSNQLKDLKQDIEHLKKEITSIEKRLKNNIIACEANTTYIDEFKRKLEVTVNSVTEMVNSNRYAMDVIFRHLRWHQVVLVLMPLLIFFALWVKNVWR
jgi:predicted  nucleic acid-binding Zn-ribbon protein